MKLDYRWACEPPYPVTIVMARYGGIYEGGRWLAFPMDPEDIDPDYRGSDIECMVFWGNDYNPDLSFIGRGLTPNEALVDLTSRLPERQAGEAWPPEVS